MPTKQTTKRKKGSASTKSAAKKRTAGVSNTARQAKKRATASPKPEGKQRKSVTPQQTGSVHQNETHAAPLAGTESPIAGKNLIVSATKIAIGTRRKARAWIKGAIDLATGIPGKVKGLRHRKKSR